MKGTVKKAIIAGVLVITVGTGSFVAYNKFFKKTASAVTSKYYTTTVKKMNLSKTIQGTGSAYAGTAKDVSANNNGTLSGLTVKVGDTVTKGQTLFVCTSSELTKAVTNAERNLTKAKAQLTADKAALDTAKAQLAADKSSAVVDSNKISADEKSISDAKTKVSDDEYTVADVKTAVADAEEAVDNQTAVSPIAGIVTAVSNSNGDTLQAGKSVVTVTDMNTLKVNVSVDELDITSVKSGLTAAITFDALIDKTFTGSVESIAQTGTTSNSVTTYNVVVSISKPTGIRLGMNANVIIAIESKENALVIPEEALVEVNGKKYVRVQSATSASTSSKTASSSSNSSNSAGNLVEIKTGMETEDYIEVTSGVTEGQTILVQLASSSSSTQSKGMGGDMGGMSGGPNGNMGGGTPPSTPGGNSNSGSSKSGN